jgi:hypothetical protein
MKTLGRHSNPTIPSVKRARKRRFLATGLLITLIVVLFWLVFFVKPWRSKSGVAESSASALNSSIPHPAGDPSSNASKTGERSASQHEAESGNSVAASSQTENSDIRPFMKLERIVAFGRSLELIGTVEAGSRLAVNDEHVEINGDGSFKHFTDPFPVTAQKVLVIMKVTDLAGRTRTESVAYNFNPRGRNN